MDAAASLRPRPCALVPVQADEDSRERPIPDLSDFDPDMMKPLFDIGREFGRNPASWVVAPSPGQNASPSLIKLLSELRRER